MNSLIDPNYTPVALRGWNFPVLNVDFSKYPEKVQEDLPDVLRWVDVIKEEPKWIKLKGEDLVKLLEDWKFVDNKEDVRASTAYKNGGKMPENEKTMKKLRVIAKEFVYKVGKHILTGHLNLTTIPFPIKAMVPKSYLEYVGCLPTAYFPLYMNLAMKSKDPLERFKYYIISAICYFYLTTSFAKPLNPILGETFNGNYDDGSHFYLEQISHHPPISYMLYYGPNESYKFWGPSMFSASAGLNSLTLSTKAWRKIHFNDNNQTIHNTFPNESYGGTLLGQTVHETTGSMEFVDEENKIRCHLEFGKVKKKPSDYLDGSIFVDGKAVSQIKGTYMGWIEIDEKRYWDYRYTQPFKFNIEKSPLSSDFQYRPDRAILALGYHEDAQTQKEQLEHVQRTDAKLRKQYKEEHKMETH